MDALTQCYAKSPDFIPRQIAGEQLLVPLRRVLGQPDALYVLNGTGGFIWNALLETAPASAVRDRLTVAFDVAPDQATRDVTELLQQLEAIGAIQPLTPAAS